MTARPIVPVIDYTSRDYEAIRADMIRLIRERLPQWAAQDPSDFGVALVEAYAYAADQMHYYLDRVANESYLGTAVQRESIMAIAAMFGYKPYDSRPSIVGLQFGNTTGSDIVVPQGARVQATIQADTETIIRTFETERELRVPANVTLDSLHNNAKAPTVTAVEGRSYKAEQLGVSAGTPLQRFRLPRMSVLRNTVSVEVALTDSVTPYSQVTRLETYGPTDRVFVVESNTDGSTTVLFGDGTNGTVPALHGVVTANYRVGGGVVDVPANTVRTLVSPQLPGIEVSNPLPAGGGRGAESLESIRINASRALRAPARRAVTLNDYVNLARAFPGVSKAKAVANNGVSVVVFVSPINDGSDEPTLDDSDRKSVQAYLEGLSVAGTSVTVVDPLYVQVYLHLTAYAAENARQDDVERNVREALNTFFDYDNLNYDDRLTIQELSTAFYDVPGLAFVQIDHISTSSKGTMKKDPIIFNELAVNAYPSYDEATSLTLSMVGGLV